MSFRITGLAPEPFQHLFGQSDVDLNAQGVFRYRADTCPGFPDRIEMREARVGESLLLLNHTCQAASSPYHAKHAIFVIEGASQKYSEIDTVPEVMANRLLSLRGFDSAGMMLDGQVVQGAKITDMIAQFFDNPKIDYIHAHNASRGCYSGRIDRI